MKKKTRKLIAELNAKIDRLTNPIPTIQYKAPQGYNCRHSATKDLFETIQDGLSDVFKESKANGFKSVFSQPIDNQIGWDKCEQKEEKKESPTLEEQIKALKNAPRNPLFWIEIQKEHEQEIREAEKQAFEESRLTNPMIGFKHDSFEDYLKWKAECERDLKSETKTEN